jgi:hypothetical protein
MDTSRIDHLIRQVSTRLSRRTLAGTLGLAALAHPFAIEASKKRKKKKIRRNSFGCVNFGGYCKRSGQCCSGICQGKKGKMRCLDHGTGGCQLEQSTVTCEGVGVPCPSAEGVCTTTTGNAAFCLNWKFDIPPKCTRDADCEAVEPGSACILCGDSSTICAFA